MKENDWIVAGLNNPDTSTSEFLISGLNIDNTQLLTPEQYKRSNFIKNKFTEDGKFNEDAFNDFYKKRASEFNRLQNLDVQDTFLYNPLDPRAAKGNKNVNSPKYDYEIVANPGKQILFFGDTYQNNLSQREQAQKNRIYDTATDTWSEDSLNERSLIESPTKWFKTVFGDPLIYATYDEDGEHYDIFTGKMVKHAKGEYKLDEQGNPYTETLNGRSLIGKEVVSASDILTIDNEGIDKYNFFDSDDVEKSVGGTIMKTAVSISPLLIPYVGTIYSGLLVGREMLKTFPMLYGMLSAWSDLPSENPTLNKLAGMANVFTTSTSDYGRSSMLNFEVLGTLMSDVVLQYGQQKAIITGINKLRGSNKLMQEAYNKAGTQYLLQKAKLESELKTGVITKEAFEKLVGNPKNWQNSVLGKQSISYYTKAVEPIVKKSNQLGANAALAYMALVSNTDVYSSMLEAGASRKEAALVGLASTIGMFSVDKYMHLGELFFDELTTPVEHQIRNTLTKEAKSWYNNVIKQTVKDPEITEINKLKRLFKSGIDFGKKQASQFAEDLKYHSTGFFGKALGEGLEEVSEEIVSDLSKGIYELMGTLGVDTSVEKVGAFDNALARYGMSLLGGTLGGGLFYGIDTFKTGKFHVDQSQNELIYLVRNGKTDEVLKTLDNWRKKGKLGSTSLSTEITKDQNDDDVFVTAEDKSKSQNEFIYNRIKETVLSLENVINENNAKLDEDALFDKMILSDLRFRQLEEYLKNQGEDLKDFSYTTGYQREYQKVLNNIVNTQSELESAIKTKSGIVDDSIATDEELRHMTEEDKKRRSSNIKKIEDKLKIHQEELQKFLSGEYSIDYTEKMLFALDKHLNEDFVAMTYDQWLKKNHNGKTIDELTPSEIPVYKKEYLNYKKNLLSKDLDEKFEIYKRIKEILNPVLLKISENQDNFKKFQQQIRKLFDDENSPLYNIKQYTFNDLLEGETEESESYINRNASLDSIKERREKIISENNKNLEKAKNEILKIIDNAGGFIDPVTRRQLKLFLFNRNKDYIDDIYFNLRKGLELDNVVVNDEEEIEEVGVLDSLTENILEVIKNINDKNLGDVDKIRLEVESLVKKSLNDDINKKNKKLRNIVEYLNDSTFGIGAFNNGNIEGNELINIIKNLENKGNDLDTIFNIDGKLFEAPEDYFDDNTEITTFLSNIRLLYEKGELDNYSWKEEVVDKIEQDKLLDKYNNILTNYVEQLQTHPGIVLNNELDKRISSINPVIDLVKSLSLSLNVNMDNLEKILNNLDKKFEENNSIEDLIISSDEQESFEEASDVIKLAKAYLYAASTTPSIISPFGHNSTLNKFAEEHKDIYKDYKPLPVLSTDVASMYENELNKYLLQMGIIDEKTQEYNPGSWMYLSKKNEGNKAKMFIDAEKAWNKTQYDLFSNNKIAFKFTHDQVEYNLLKGIETIPTVTKDSEDALMNLTKLFSLFHNNIQELIDKGWTYKQIFERSNILEQLCGTKGDNDVISFDDIVKQKTTKLNKGTTIDNLTNYDKMVLLLTAGSIDPIKFISYLKTRIDEENGIVPLTIQEWISRVHIALRENPEIFNQALDYIEEKAKIKLPRIFNAVYSAGSAGAGKSRVVGRNFAKYLKSNNIWLSAPKESQVDTLFESVGKGEISLIRDTSSTRSDLSSSLMQKIGVDKTAYDAAMLAIRSGKEDSNYFTVTNIQGVGNIIKINPDKFGIKKIDNAPEAIIIDEATHLSNLELQLLSHFAKLNETTLHFLGDNKQKGFNGYGQNINRENCFIIRAPELDISLRDNNMQHYTNLKTLEDLITTLQNADSSDDDYKVKIATIKSTLNNIKFKVYTQDDVHGDLLTSSLTPDIISKFKENSEIGYVGKNGETLNLLQKSGFKVTVLPETDIQGQEFDYVVIDKDFDSDFSTDLKLLNFLQDLYTMISRGRNGSVIVDPNNNLRRIIGTNKEEFVLSKVTSILKYAEDFRNKKLDDINKILANFKRKSETKPEVKPSTEPETKPETPPNSEPEKTVQIKLDSNFNIDELDFDNNIYAVHQTDKVSADIISEKGIQTTKNFEDIAELVDKEQLKNLIKTQKENQGGYIVLMPFSKTDFYKDNLQLEDISKKINELENKTDSNIPLKYIDTIINVEKQQQKADIKTDDDDKAKKPQIDVDPPIDFGNDLDPEDIAEDPMLCYGQATFSGFQVKKEKGKSIWINPKREIKRDGQLFTDQNEITDTDQQIRISINIRRLKNGFLYRKKYEDLHRDVRNVISEDQYNNMNWFIEVSPYDEINDNFIRNTGFKESGMKIGSKELVFKVVGEWEDPDGSKKQITLGLMSDPDNWISQIKDKTIPNRILNKIEKLKAAKEAATLESIKQQIQSKIDRYLQYLDSIDIDNSESQPNKYKQYIDKLSDLYDPNKGSLIIGIPTIIFPGLTNLHKQNKSVRVSRISRELIANAKTRIDQLEKNLSKAKNHGNSFAAYNIANEIIRTRNKLREFEKIHESSFTSLNPYAVVSPMYIYTPSQENGLGVDDSLIGACNVIFVSDDDSLDAESLVDIYINQKNAASNEKEAKGYIDFKNSNVVPSVRMIRLDNLGVSFQDMSDPYLMDSMRSVVEFRKKEGTITRQESIYPFKTNYMGVRMYVSLWNFRANLLHFTEKLNKFVKTLPIKEEDLDKYLLVKDLKWRKENSKDLTDVEQDFLSKNENLDKLDEVSKLIDTFNDSLASEVKQFRLGGSFNGAYVRQLTGDTSLLYKTKDNKKPNGIYLDISTAKKYYNIVNSLFTDILDHIVTCEYDQNKLLSTKEGVKNSFANHITTLAQQNGVIKVKDPYDGVEYEIKFGSQYDKDLSRGILNTFSHIPAVLSKVFKFTSIRQMHLTNKFDTENLYSIRITGDVDINGVKTDIDEAIPYTNLWQHLNIPVGVDQFDVEEVSNLVFDRSLSNLFSFCFHGTLENVNDVNDITKESKAIRASDALFPYGLYADPLSTTETVSGVRGKLFTKSIQQTWTFGSNVSVGSPTFYISMQELNKALEDSQKPVIVDTSNDQEIEEKINKYVNDMITKYPQLSSKISDIVANAVDLKGDEKFESIEYDINLLLQTQAENNYINLFSSTEINVDSLLKNNGKYMTLKKIISELYETQTKQKLANIVDIKNISNSLLITTEDNVELELTKGLNGLVVKVVGKPGVSDSEINKIIDNINKIIGLLDSAKNDRKANKDIKALLDQKIKSLQNQIKVINNKKSSGDLEAIKNIIDNNVVSPLNGLIIHPNLRGLLKPMNTDLTTYINNIKPVKCD